jgi:phosphomethylpyrimidine synthase
MNAPEKIPFADQFALSRQPFPASRKVHVAGTQPGVNVPMREILLTNGERVTVYDTSGPYSDPTASIDIRRGLPDLRGPWLDARSAWMRSMVVLFCSASFFTPSSSAARWRPS